MDRIDIIHNLWLRCITMLFVEMNEELSSVTGACDVSFRVSNFEISKCRFPRND